MTSEKLTPQDGIEIGELELLLRQVEQSSTHYEAMGLARSASADEVKQAYHRAVTLLNPANQTEETLNDSDLSRGAAVGARLVARIDQAFDRVSLAFSVLANASKRAEYDRFMLARSSGLLPASASDQSHNNTNGKARQSAAETDEAESSKGLAIYDAPAKVVAEDNRRRTQRFNLIVPALICGYDRKEGKWEELAETINVSRTGLRLRIRRRVRHGTIIHLALPMPMKLRNHDFAEPTYGVYALVRRVEPSKKGVRVIAVEFVGQQPPKGYLDKPWAVFQTKTWAGRDRRRKPRHSCSEVVWLEYYNEAMQCIRQDAGRAENVSEGGARVSVKQAPAEFELLKISYPERGMETFAVVCSRFTGKDALERLCLRFVEATDLAPRQQEVRKPAQVAADENLKPENACPEPQSASHPLTKAEQPRAKTTEPAAEPFQPAAVQPRAEAIKAETQREGKPRRHGVSESKAPRESTKNKLGKILVADDDAPLRKVLGKILTTAGYDVILVGDGKAAVDKAKIERPDLVITDGLMPKMHGFLVCKTIKEMPAPPKVIMLTAVYTKMQYKWEAKEKYGADELLTKPFEVAELLACVERQLSHSAHAEAIPALQLEARLI